jgi:hypothetical protein
MIGNKHAAGHTPNLSSFKIGQVPWNKGIKDNHCSPRTEFRKGLIPANKLPIGSVKIRTFRRGGEQRAFIKIGEPDVWRERAVLVWESANGPVPKGMVVHHNDRNTLHDDLSNLSLLSRANHLREHRPEFENKRLAALKSNAGAGTTGLVGPRPGGGAA